MEYTSSFVVCFSKSPYSGHGYYYWDSDFAFDDIRVYVPLRVAAELADGDEWVYQNTETTTQDRHFSTATISLVSEASPGEGYNISIADDGPDGANFTLGAITDNRPGLQTLTVKLIGGRIGTTTPGVAAASYTVTITLEGQTSLETDSAEVEVVLRYLGDIDGSGTRVGLDKQYFYQRLNNVATGFPDRCYDLDGEGTVVGLDKQWMNQLLNNVTLP